MHISKIKDKSARNLAQSEMPDDGYHNGIKLAAIMLCEEGYEDYLYYATAAKECNLGLTPAVLWASPADPNVVIRSIAFSPLSKYARAQEVASAFYGNVELELSTLEMESVEAGKLLGDSERFNQMTEDELLK